MSVISLSGCAFLDANLNGKSSAPVAAELRASSIPFVVVTGYGQLTLETDALSAAPRLTKPFNTGEFKKVLAANFCRRQAAKPLNIRQRHGAGGTFR